MRVIAWRGQAGCEMLGQFYGMGILLWVGVELLDTILGAELIRHSSNLTGCVCLSPDFHPAYRILNNHENLLYLDKIPEKNM